MVSSVVLHFTALILAVSVKWRSTVLASLSSLDPPVSALRCWGDGHSCPYLAFYMGARDPNSGDDTYKVGVSPAESFAYPASTLKRLAFTFLLEKSKWTFNYSLQEF